MGNQKQPGWLALDPAIPLITPLSLNANGVPIISIEPNTPKCPNTGFGVPKPDTGMTELFEDVSSLEDCVEKVKTSSIGANALKYVEDAWECTAVAGATKIETHENDPFQITKSCVFQG